MVPQKELQELARAMKQSDEYMQMIKLRNKIMSEPALGRQMLAFERDQARLIKSNMSDTDVSTRFKQLNTQYKAMLEREDVKGFVTAATRYQKMVTDSFATLNRMLDINGTGRPY